MSSFVSKEVDEIEKRLKGSVESLGQSILPKYPAFPWLCRSGLGRGVLSFKDASCICKSARRGCLDTLLDPSC